MCCREAELTILIGDCGSLRHKSVLNPWGFPSLLLEWVRLLEAAYGARLQRLLVNVLLTVDGLDVAADVGGCGTDVWQVSCLLIHRDCQWVKDEIVVLCLNRVLARRLIEVDIVDAFVVSFRHLDTIDEDFGRRNRHLFKELDKSSDRATEDLEARHCRFLSKLDSHGTILGFKELAGQLVRCLWAHQVLPRSHIVELEATCRVRHLALRSSSGSLLGVFVTTSIEWCNLDLNEGGWARITHLLLDVALN